MNLTIAITVCALALTACEREQRSFQTPAPEREAIGTVPTTPLAPGGKPAPLSDPDAQHFEKNAYALSEGKRLFSWFNCTGCHSHGGGGSGPALMDETWIYGGSLRQIAVTIRDGRPNGMPGFGGKITEHQIWEIAAYIRSMGRAEDVPKDAAPGRDDSLQARPAENRQEAVQPFPSTAPQ